MKNAIPQYYIAYEPDESGGYIASAPAVPGCVVHGKTLEEAYTNIQPALYECLEVLQEFSKKAPRETIVPSAVKRFSFVKLPKYA